MTTPPLLSEQTAKEFRIPVLTAILLILFLFYIDEGYYNFKWMKEPGNWVAFVIYLLAFVFGQIISSFLILKKYTGKYRVILISLIGIPLGFGLIMLLFYLSNRL
ncbi:MAG: hypothetical protein PSX36_15875 [bacterium]|nr:hypothetical protein [bacterium]